MNKVSIKKIKKLVNTYDSDRISFLKNPKNKILHDFYSRQLEAAYSLLQMRKKKKMSQALLAKKLGTTQSNVARMESGNQNFSLATLGKIAHVFGKELQVTFK